MEKEVDLCPILYIFTIFNREKQIFDHTSRWNIFVTLFLSYKELIEQWCSKNVHMERVRSTQVIVKQLVWCFILFSRRTSLEYPVWQERLSCWKENLASNFFFLFSLYFQSESELPQIYCWTVHQAGFWNLCSFIQTRLHPEGISGSTAPFPRAPPILPRARSAPMASALAPVMLHQGWSSASHSPATLPHSRSLYTNASSAFLTARNYYSVDFLADLPDTGKSNTILCCKVLIVLLWFFPRLFNVI